MSVSFFSPARTVLLIGDESLYVYKVNRGGVSLVDSLPWKTEGFEGALSALISKDCGGKPVLILNDMTDQHFKGGQRMPRVGAMDRKNVLKRKLQVSFPNYPIKGALQIKSKEDKGVKGAGVKQGGGLYLFAAVPASEPVINTLESVRLSMAPIVTFSLLPVESSDMVRALSVKLSGRSKRAAKWVVFMGQHEGGALRQVIIRDGNLAMTRMTPVADPEADSHVWAQEVSQEFKATVSYLSRFGYSAEEGTDVIVISGRQAGEALEKLIDIPCDFKSMTAPEAAHVLGLNLGVQEAPYYADSLHVAWVGRKTRFILPMESVDIGKVNNPRKAAMVVAMLLFLSSGFLGWQLFTQARTMMETKEDIDLQRTLLAKTEAEYQDEVKRMAALGFDVNLIQGTIGAYEEFEAGSVDFLPVFMKIGKALGNDLRLDSLVIDQVQGGEAVDVNGVPGISKAKLEAELSLSFSQTIEPEIGMREVNNLARRLRNELPDYDVTITRQVARPEYDQNIKGVAGRTAQEIAAQEDYVAKLSLKGPK